MPEVIFNESKLSSEDRIAYSVSTRISKWIVRNSYGLIKDEKQAETLLAIICMLVLVISIYYIFFGGGPKLPAGIRNVPPQGLPVNAAE